MAVWNRGEIIEEKTQSLLNTFLDNVEKNYHKLQDLKEDISSIPMVDSQVFKETYRSEVYDDMLSKLSPNEDLKNRYCISALMICLLQADKENKLTEYELLPKDGENLTRCASYVHYLESTKFGKYVYKTKGDMSFFDIIKEKELKPGTLLILTNKKRNIGEPSQYDVSEATLDGNNHAMVLSSYDEEAGLPLFSGFFHEKKDIPVKGHKHGYVIDLPSCIHQVFKSEELKALKNERIAESIKKPMAPAPVRQFDRR